MMRRWSALALVLVVAACSGRDSMSAVDAGSPEPAVAPVEAGRLERAAIAKGMAPLSVDDLGRPRLLRAARALPVRGATADSAARAEIAELAPVWGLEGRVAADLEVAYVHELTGGATLVALEQRVGGIAIAGGGLRVLLGADRSLQAVSGTRYAADTAPRAGVRVTAPEALAAAIADRVAVAVPAAEITALRARGEWRDLSVAARPDLAVGPASARRVLVPDGDRLTAAWMVEMFASTTQQADARAWRVIVDAATGTVLRQNSLTEDDAFTYRAYADADTAGRPFEGPQESFAPHPTGTPDGIQPAFVDSNLVTMDGFATPLDPWLPDDAVETQGNNVDAYVDLNDGANGFTEGVDFRAATTTTGAFDHTYDTTAGPLTNATQQQAAIVNLFYVINWLHDWWYDSGFDESAGNAQADNLGRGGVEGDVLHAEAQDNAIGDPPATPPSRNNANMSTPSDGMSPQMQMFLWGGLTQRSLTLNPGNLTPNTGTAAFGPQSFDVTADVVVADVANGCTAPTNVTGKIALIDRGTCSFQIKAESAAAGGAIGVIIGNVATSANPTVAPNAAGTGPTLPPTLTLNLADANNLKALVAAGPVTARLYRLTGVERDGDLDITIVAHEWGHYFHHRATECDATKQCSAMSEGWADFTALHLALRAEDDPHLIYPLAIYATKDPYFGIRRAPYSVNFTANGLTFKNIQDSQPAPTGFPFLAFGINSEVHNAGEIWTVMLWEMYVALIDVHGFEPARRLMSDYVVAGLQLAPPNHTYTEMRDAILAAVSVMSPPDLAVAANAFARRGAGTCAVSPASSSTNFNGVAESFTLSGALKLGAITLDDDAVSCDQDGALDPGETGTLRVDLGNAGPVSLAGTTIDVTTSTPGVTIVDASRPVASLAAFGSLTESFTVRLDPGVDPSTPITFDVTVADPASCLPSITASQLFLTGYDDVAALASNDDVESDHEVWTRGGALGAVAWNRAPIAGATVAWLGADLGSAADVQLISPPLEVGADPFVVSFSHRFSFEFSTPSTYWDGGMIELSTDGGTTWADVSTLGVTPGYNGTLGTTSQNPLGGRLAFGRTNAAWPARETLTLDFGTQFADSAVQLRFRIGTDAGTGAYGWEIDDLTFGGITNTPFGQLVDEGVSCQAAPVADAGADQLVIAGDTVDLDGSDSSDPNSDPITYAWTQIGGVPVTVTDDNDPQPSFVAPDGAVDLRLTFRLTVSDPFASDTDEVVIDVDVDNTPADAGPPDASVPPADAGPPPDAGPPDAASPPDVDAAGAPPDAGTTGGGDGGGCCQTEQSPGLGLLAPIALVGFALRRRRRVGR